MSLKKIYWILFLLSNVSCALNPPNIEVCGKLPDGAICGYTIDGTQRRMTNDEWNKVGRFSMSAEAYGELKKFILKACEKNNECNDDEIEQFYDQFE